MTPLYPPVVPGLTEGAEGSEKIKTLLDLARMFHDNKKDTEAFLKRIFKMSSPVEPPPEPLESGMQLPGGQVSPPFNSQLAGRPGF